MLGLKLPTDPRWVCLVEKNPAEILTDHAYCEQKAASAAISFIVSFPEKSELVEAMIGLAQEEMEHFKRVYQLLRSRGWALGRERKDAYVAAVMTFFPKGGSRETHLTNRLLCAALIEARSCERFRLLSEELPDPELAAFYRELMASEARHYTLFLRLARAYAPRAEVTRKWRALLEYEAELMKNLGKKETIHG